MLVSDQVAETCDACDRTENLRALRFSICGKNDLFSVVIAFRMLLSKDYFAEFKKSLNQIMNQYMKKTSNLSQDIFLKAMGFPENWKSISRYKL